MISDEHLIQRVRSGNTKDYTELMTRYQSSAFWLALRITNRREEAEDAVQEAFVKAYTKLDTYRGSGGFWAWVRKILVNVCLSRVSAEARYRALEDLPETDGGCSYSLEEEVLARAEREDLRKAVAGLPAHYRVAIVLRYQEDLGCKETADLLGVSVSSVKVRLHRARKMLAQQMEKSI